MENPAFSDDQADIGTSGNYRTVIDGNEASHYMVGADEVNANSGKTNDKDATHIRETLDSSTTTGQDKGVPMAQVAPRVQAEQVPDTSGNSETAKDVQVTDLDSVAIAINGDTEKKTEDVAVNMQLERVKRSVKKTNSLQGIFSKVRTPSQKELDPR